MKPRVNLVGKDGNVYNIIGIVSKALKNVGMTVEANEFVAKAFASKSYDEVLLLCCDYVDVY